MQAIDVATQLGDTDPGFTYRVTSCPATLCHRAQWVGPPEALHMPHHLVIQGALLPPALHVNPERQQRTPLQLAAVLPRCCHTALPVPHGGGSPVTPTAPPPCQSAACPQVHGLLQLVSLGPAVLQVAAPCQPCTALAAVCEDGECSPQLALVVGVVPAQWGSQNSNGLAAMAEGGKEATGEIGSAAVCGHNMAPTNWYPCSQPQPSNTTPCMPHLRMPKQRWASAKYRCL